MSDFYTATIRFSADNREAAEHLFKAFRLCIADHVTFNAKLEGPVIMNLCVENRPGIRPQGKEVDGQS
jgi:hypothetical protein